MSIINKNPIQFTMYMIKQIALPHSTPNYDTKFISLINMDLSYLSIASSHTQEVFILSFIELGHTYKVSLLFTKSSLYILGNLGIIIYTHMYTIISTYKRIDFLQSIAFLTSGLFCQTFTFTLKMSIISYLSKLSFMIGNASA